MSESRQSAPGYVRWIGWVTAACVAVLASVLLFNASNSAPKRAAPDAAKDAQGWAVLGRSLASRGHFADAAHALAEALRHQPGDASLLADRADFLAMAQGRRFAGEPDRLIRSALETDPRHTKALALAGTASFERGDFAGAAAYWRRLLALISPASEMAREVEARTRDAERRAVSGAGPGPAGEQRP